MGELALFPPDMFSCDVLLPFVTMLPAGQTCAGPADGWWWQTHLLWCGRVMPAGLLPTSLPWWLPSSNPLTTAQAQLQFGDNCWSHLQR